MKQFSDFPGFRLGTQKLQDGRYSFKVWAPFCSRVGLKLFPARGERSVVMEKDNDGYFHAQVSGISCGIRYFYVLDGKKERPDPASRFQPGGVHGPSCLIDPDEYTWRDRGWKGRNLRELVFYETHIGTFTREGTFAAAAKKISYLKRLGITCVEVMPVAQFPGKRNWGYDGVGLFAVQNSYGGPEGFKKFVDACHCHGLAVCLDVVYNHLGPEGNYLNDFGPYFTDKYHTPWGKAINYDDRESDQVRNFIIENALRWILEYHIDVLRLDAIHGIYDFSARHILKELNDAVTGLGRKLGRRVHLVAESDLNDSRIIRSVKQGGYGLSGQWSDDFHHAVHAYVTAERNGYYRDFGRLSDIARAISDGFVYGGRYSPFRRRRHGDYVKDLAPEKLVVCVQNHDQVGNRAFGERLSLLADFARQKIAAVLLMMSPNTPLIFMGQEYGEEAAFQYFIDHADPGLIKAVREGRKKEFAAFGWKDIPDPQSQSTFFNSRLTWNIPAASPRAFLLRLYRDLITFRKKILSRGRLNGVHFDEKYEWLIFEYIVSKRLRVGIVVSFFEGERCIGYPFGRGNLREIINTNHSRYGGKMKKGRSAGNGVILFPSCGAVVVEKTGR